MHCPEPSSTLFCVLWVLCLVFWFVGWLVLVLLDFFKQSQPYSPELWYVFSLFSSDPCDYFDLLSLKLL